MTLGEDGRILVYDYENEKIILEKQYSAVGTDLLWFGPKVSDSCMELVASFEDGILRQIYLDLTHPHQPNIYLIRPIKTHTAAITKITINPMNTLLITGSADRSIFLYSLKDKNDAYMHLQPLGFVQFEAIPNCFYWKDEESTILVGCKSGEVYEYRLPLDVSEEQVFLSYNLTDKSAVKSVKFNSVKSQIRRELRREEIKRRKEKKRQRKLDDIERLKAANPGLQIDMEAALGRNEAHMHETFMQGKLRLNYLYFQLILSPKRKKNLCTYLPYLIQYYGLEQHQMIPYGYLWGVMMPVIFMN